MNKQALHRVFDVLDHNGFHVHATGMREESYRKTDEGVAGKILHQLGRVCSDWQMQANPVTAAHPVPVESSIDPPPTSESSADGPAPTAESGQIQAPAPAEETSVPTA